MSLQIIPYWQFQVKEKENVVNCDPNGLINLSPIWIVSRQFSKAHKNAKQFYWEKGGCSLNSICTIVGSNIVHSQSATKLIQISHCGNFTIPNTRLLFLRDKLFSDLPGQSFRQSLGKGNHIFYLIYTFSPSWKRKFLSEQTRSAAKEKANPIE